jgi:hypothetical protein
LPAGTIVSTAFSIQWLETILHTFYSNFPWAATVTLVAGATVPHLNTYVIPTNFILDVKNGLILNINGSWKRVFRKPIQNFIDIAYNMPEGPPRIYTLGNNYFGLAPTPDIEYSGRLWYYALPAPLEDDGVPVFPSDLILVNYIRLVALEWIRALPIGSAQAYTEGKIAELIRAGLGNEPENEEIPLGSSFLQGAGPDNTGSSSWMGEVGT